MSVQVDHTSRQANRIDLCDVAAETQELALKYAFKNQKISDSIRCTTKHRFSQLPMAIENDKNSMPGLDAIVDVVKEDTADRGAQLLAKGYNPVILNLASNVRPGGGWENGAMAQEEALFFRSTYHLALTRQYYPIQDNECVYTPDVYFFRDNQFKNFAKLPDAQHFYLASIALPALRHPKLVNQKYTAEDEKITAEKIDAIFKTAILHKHDAIVLGALGAGVYANPPSEVARIFNDHVKKYRAHFKYISFAVIDPPGRDGIVRSNNYEIFKNNI